MSHLQALNRRVDRLLLHIDGRLDELHQDSSESLTPPMANLSDEEQEQFDSFSEQLTPRIQYSQGRLDLSLLNDEELDQLRLWCELHKALESGDQAQAERCRRWLSCSIEQMIRYSSCSASM
jgi:hypothetical protein